MNIEIEKLTTWSAGREVRTQNGPRILRKGPLTAEYRAAWRANKEAMKAVGLSMGPVDRNDPQGDWEAIWWQPLNGEVAKERDAAVEASRATDAAVEIPAPDGLAYMPFQKAGIAFATGKSGVLLADEMGLGKTIQAIGIINADPSIKRVLVVCPASLKVNWRNELNKWLVRPARVAIQNSGQPWAGSVADIIVVNYDILGKFTRQLMSETWDLLVADECQYAKNPQAQRTKLLVGAQRKADREKYPGIRAVRKVAATGTPILNKPVELFPILDYIAPGQWGFKDKIRYCKGYKGRWGWDFTGHAHEEEFQRRLRETVMVRRLKRDVLTELPAKRRQIIELDAGDAASLCAEEVDLYDGNSEEIEAASADKALAEAADDEEAYKNAVARLRSAQKVAFERISKVRHEVALAKVEQAVDHVMDVLESTPKLVVFAHHLDVIARIERELTERLQAEGSASNPVCVVTGQTPVGERQGIVDRFNTDPGKRALILGIHAVGVGLSVKASVGVFVELEWVPGIISQAEDRCLLEKSLVCYRRPAIMSGMSLTAIENIREGDEVLTEAGKFAKVLRVHQHSEHHPMVTEIEYVGWHEPLRCTYDHAIFVRRDGKNRWVLAHELLPNDSMVFPKMADCTPLQYVEIKKEWRLYETGQKSQKCIKCGASQIEARSMCRVCYRKEIHGKSRPPKPVQINPRYVRLPDHIEINDEWLYLFGWYAAEGFASISPGKSRFVSFSGHEEEEPTLRRIEKTINALGIKCGLCRNRKTKGIELRAYSGELALWFRDWFGHTAAHKKLPDVLTEVSSEQSAIILRGYTDGDGCRRSHSDGKSVEVRWSSKSQQLSWQMAMLAVKAGFIPRMKVEGDQQWAGAYTDGRCGNKRLREQDNEFIYRPIRSVKTERVKDHKWVKLYDLTVEGDHHSFTVGFATVHNCHGIGRGIEGEPLLVQHLVLEGSLDSRMAKIVVAKQDVADRMLDKDMAKLATGEPVTALDIEFDADKVQREDAKAEDPELHDAVLRGLQMLAGVCDGATMRDDMGFNGCDARIGHSLARLSRLSPKQVALGRRLLIKYRRQLPDDVNAKIRDNE